MIDDPASLDEEFGLGGAAVEPTVDVHCPYCGEPSEILVDPASGVDQSYVEDCPVCCRPWEIRVRFTEGIPFVEIGTEDDPGY